MRIAGVVLLLLSAAAVQAHAPRLLVQGRVVVRGSNVPIPNARLVAAKVGGTQSDYGIATSDASGRFVIRDLSPGTYRIHADHPGHIRTEFGRPAVAPTGTPIQVTEGASPDLVIAMTPTGVVAGRVTHRGLPLRRVIVRALKPTYFDGRRSLTVAERTTTDDLGEYRLFGLAPGSYFISATPAGRSRLEGDILVTPTIPSNANGNRSELRSPATMENVSASALDSRVFPPSFYPGTFDPSAATAIEVGAGASVLSIDLTVSDANVFHVRGRVTVEGLPTPPGRLRIWAQPVEPFAGSTSPSIEAQVGDFDLPAVPPGRYWLVVQALYPPGQGAGPMAIARVPLEVWDRDVEGVSAALSPGITLTGRVLIDGAVPAADQRPSVSLIGLDGTPGPGLRRVEVDGTFRIELITPGRYHIRLLPAPGAGVRVTPWLKTARFGGEEVSGRIIRVGAEVAAHALEIDISTRTASLEALVLDDRRRPAAGLLVVAVPDLARRDQSEAYRSGLTDAEGRVRLPGVVPGTYTLFATETVALDSWQDPAILKLHEARGKVVTLSEGAVQIVELRKTS